jgi:hypothetical protein
MQALIKLRGALFDIAGEVRTTDGAYKERVTSEEKPGFRSSCLVCD